KHDLEHRPGSGYRGAVCGTRHRQLGNGRVKDATTAVFLVEAGCHREHSAGDRNVLAKEQHTLVAGKLVVERGTNRFAQLELHHAPVTSRRSSPGCSSSVRTRRRKAAASAP